MGMLGTSLAVITLVGIALVTTLSVPAQAEDASIPSWIKQVATLWGSGQISDTEFIEALRYLVQVGILVVPESGQVTDAVKDTVPEPTPATLPGTVHPEAVIGAITRIVDGDTIHFNDDVYRLSLIDTPERGEDGYAEATDALTEICPIGSTAYMEADSLQGLDRYGRYLGVVWCEGNDYSTTAGEYLHANGLLKKFYVNYCDSMEAATAMWAEESGNWFYHSVCN